MTALKTITTRAKALRRAHKNMSWKDAVKKSSVEYNKKHSGKKKSARKKQSNHRTRLRFCWRNCSFCQSNPMPGKNRSGL